jgi:hypothetical protein
MTKALTMIKLTPTSRLVHNMMDIQVQLKVFNKKNISLDCYSRTLAMMMETMIQQLQLVIRMTKKTIWLTNKAASLNAVVDSSLQLMISLAETAVNILEE